MSALTDYAENKTIDAIFRGQPLGAPATLYVALVTAADTDAAAAAEVSGGGYARVAVPCSLASFAGTQAPASTVASSGTSGTTSNNNAITFPASTGAWSSGASIVGFELWDAASGGNRWVYGTLAQPLVVGSAGITPSIAAAALTFQVDN